MITIVDGGNIFDSKCYVLVNPVNCVGVMGAGLALQFKEKFPTMYADYVDKCKRGKVSLGRPYIFHYPAHSVINFPTKHHWREKSIIESVDDGLGYFVDMHREWGVKSVAFPALGCGNGGLEWSDVKPVMMYHLNRVSIDCFVYVPVESRKRKV